MDPILYQNLENALEEEVKIYRILLDSVRREKDLLIAANIEEISENNKTKETLILKLRGLERIREKAAREFAQTVGGNTEKPRLLELATLVPEPQSTKLRSIHSTLELLVQRIKDFNAQNGRLVEDGLKVINGTLDVIRDTVQPKVTYGQKGDMVKTDPQAGNFVSKEV